MTPRYLTKSRFILALECPTKMYYDKKQNTPEVRRHFLMDLAKGDSSGRVSKTLFSRWT